MWELERACRARAVGLLSNFFSGMVNVVNERLKAKTPAHRYIEVEAASSS